MTQNEIIELARETGMETNEGFSESVFYFAKLVAAKEREACAKVVEESSLPDTYSQECLPDIANEIRAKGEQA